MINEQSKTDLMRLLKSILLILRSLISSPFIFLIRLILFDIFSVIKSKWRLKHSFGSSWIFYQKNWKRVERYSFVLNFQFHFIYFFVAFAVSCCSEHGVEGLFAVQFEAPFVAESFYAVDANLQVFFNLLFGLAVIPCTGRRRTQHGLYFQGLILQCH